MVDRSRKLSEVSENSCYDSNSEKTDANVAAMTQSLTKAKPTTSSVLGQFCWSQKAGNTAKSPNVSCEDTGDWLLEKGGRASALPILNDLSDIGPLLNGSY